MYQSGVLNDEFLEQIVKEFDKVFASLYVPQEFIDWALEELQKSNKVELKSRSQIDKNLHQKLEQVNGELDNLLTMYLSVENKEKSFYALLART